MLLAQLLFQKDQMWGLSKDVLYFSTDNVNDYAILDNTFLNFSETYQEILWNQDVYSWNDAKKKVLVTL